MHEKYYLDKLYPLQDKILDVIEQLKLDFYLTGGTALSRCYLQHRYSDDLDFFVNEAKEKDLWVEPIEICRIINQFPNHMLKTIKWIADVNLDTLKEQIKLVHDDIFMGKANSLVN